MADAAFTEAERKALVFRKARGKVLDTLVAHGLVAATNGTGHCASLKLTDKGEALRKRFMSEHSQRQGTTYSGPPEAARQYVWNRPR